MEACIAMLISSSFAYTPLTGSFKHPSNDNIPGAIRQDTVSLSDKYFRLVPPLSLPFFQPSESVAEARNHIAAGPLLRPL